MLVFPNCKINLGLSITEKRSDNYHNIESVFYPIPLFDVLEVVESKTGQTTFDSEGIRIPGNPKSNLCLKAYELIRNDFDLPPVQICLLKNIPIGAGLGGGSSDAAFSLKLLNELFGLNLSKDELVGYAVKLGADCAFFIENKAVFVSGIGNLFTQIKLSLKDYYIVLIKPEIHISTVEAYANIIPRVKEKSIQQTAIAPIERWKASLTNDFEMTLFKEHPEIARIKNDLYRKGAVYASMSGSGSSVFGIFKEKVDFKADFPECFYWSHFLK